ncbi:hypothetical protein BCR44DRAFT_1402268 [Catenaria anguillulae PL171]|uniref:MIOS-like alpha-solenoid domain-containing protein n=1 Tax=Catenaria anguillulae PL171 TaxID=765915 RepID=A0A1Y2HRD7_9FUNG|nr:hypothetical protein BCR44DRAFT_1402268 [Catenaria anguillulae PL171]
MSVSRPRRTLWSPHGHHHLHTHTQETAHGQSHDPRVLVASHDVRLYAFHHSSASFRHVLSLSDPLLQNWKCLAWSPDPAAPDIVSAGLANGKIALVRLPSAAQVLDSMEGAVGVSSSVSAPLATNGTATADGSMSYISGLGPLASAAGNTPSTHHRHYPHHQHPHSSPATAHAPLTSSIVAELSLRFPRACHSLDFNNHDPTLLASGHEKTRNEHCLLIWDIEAHTRSNGSSPIDGLAGDSRGLGTSAMNPPMHARHHSGGDPRRTSGLGASASLSKGFGSMMISSGIVDDMALYQSSSAYPGSSVMTNSNRYSFTGQRTDRTAIHTSPRTHSSTPLYQYGSSESVSSLAWLRDHHRHIVAGMGLKYLRMFDLRVDSASGPVLAYSTRAVFGVTPDPFNAHRFASYAEDGVVKVWDVRRVGEPVVVVPPPSVLDAGKGASGVGAGANRDARDAAGAGAASASIVHIAFAPNRAGVLGVVYRDMPGLKVYELIDQPAPTTPLVPLADTGSDLGSRGAAAGGGGGAGSVGLGSGDSMCVLRTRVCGSTSAAAFDFAPPTDKGACQVVLLSRPAAYGGGQTGQGQGGQQQGGTGVAGSLSAAVAAAAAAGGGVGPGAGVGPIGGGPGPTASAGGPSNAGNSGGGASPPGPVTSSAAALNTVAGEYRLELVTLYNTPQAAWNPNASLAIAGGTMVTFKAPDVLPGLTAQEDLTTVMKRRALSGYSMNVGVNQAITAQDGSDSGLRLLWEWIARMERLLAQNRVQIGGLDFSWLGVQRVLQGLTANASTQTKDAFSTVYTSTQRRLALSFCGWSGRDELEVELQRLERSGQYEKAALWAFLHSDLTRAIQALLASKDEKLHLVSAALAGYVESPQPAWIHLCRSLSQELTRPELRTMFTYFSTNDWTTVVFETLEMHERLLVALRYFPDAELLDYVERVTEQAVYDGDLHGILMTGCSPEGVELLQRYVDMTADVQTAALAMSFAVPRRFKDTRVMMWVDEYRDFLDHQQLFFVRAHLDIALARVSGPENVDIAPQVHARCNFCNQSISQSVFLPGIKDREGRRVALNAAALGSMPKQKTNACPNCRKSLPRCSYASSLWALRSNSGVRATSPLPARAPRRT